MDITFNTPITFSKFNYGVWLRNLEEIGLKTKFK